MSTSEEQKDFQAWFIDASDHDRTIVFKGEWITIYNRTTKNTPVKEGSPDTEKEYTIEADYECILHGGGEGSFARISDKTP
ncbi:hypothetical protein CJF30_00011399 [Rutstroemia sp. NJR-2017a BBW]|nr:hypothetical protein CJF30_00011399 [Rutstroemia sp. NJR-2017a BBW]